MSAGRSALTPSWRAIALLGAVAAMLALAMAHGGWRAAVTGMVGLFAGNALYHAGFGFTVAWRRFITDRAGAGLRAQIILLGAASIVFFPLLALGEVFGGPISGFVFPIGWALGLGAFLFGIGMQLGGGCGSGTLFAVGGGSARMIVTLVFFIIGSTFATAWSDTWLAWPALAPISIVAQFGAPRGIVAMLTLLALLYLAVAGAERRRYGQLASIRAPETRWISGPWSLLAGALALAFVNIAMLLVNGWPWAITSAFALWGSKIAFLAGWSPADWAYWKGQEAILAAPVFADPTSIADFGIILGAMFAAIVAGRFRPAWDVSPRPLVAAIIGGLLLGIGARLGTGCNIGAFFSGTVSGSLHGWAWLVCAFAGSALGVRLRALFHLD